MRTLYEALKTLDKSYYHILINIDRLFSSNETSFTQCLEFIENHFIRGKKEKALLIPQKYKSIYKTDGKHQHTVLLYLLGLLFENRFDDILKNKLKSLIEDPDLKDWYNFKYSWYLTCLYHDVSSCIEKDVGTPNENYNIVLSEFLKTEDKYRRFSPKTYINYLTYRKSKGSFEHGIIGGAALYKSLINSFKSHTKGHDWNLSKVCTKNRINWRREHLLHFAYVCDAICCHNIWLANEKDKKTCEEYAEYNLEELVVHSDSDKLQFKQYPIQFLLCLLDTIEPLKKFDLLKPIDVFKNIFININQIGIILGWTDIIKEQPNFYKWLDAIHSLSNWMNVNVSPCYHEDGNCFINISFLEEAA